MEQLAISLATVASVLSVLSLLVSIGTASRLQRRWVRSSQMGGIGVGAEIAPDILARIFTSEYRRALFPGPTLVAFLSSGCRACVSVVDQLNSRYADQSIPAVMIEPAAQDSFRSRARFQALWISDDPGGGIQAEFGSQVTPHVFVLEKGRVVGQNAGSEISNLLEQIRPSDLPHAVLLST